MENIKEKFARLYAELDLTDDQFSMLRKLQRDVEEALRQLPVSSSVPSYKENWNPDWKGDPNDENRWKGW